MSTTGTTELRTSLQGEWGSNGFYSCHFEHSAIYQHLIMVPFSAKNPIVLTQSSCLKGELKMISKFENSSRLIRNNKENYGDLKNILLMRISERARHIGTKIR